MTTATATTSTQSVPTEGVQGDISADISVYARQGFGTPLPLKAPFGLLIIDFVNGFADPAVFGGGNIPEAIAQTQHLLAHARERGATVLLIGSQSAATVRAALTGVPMRTQDARTFTLKTEWPIQAAVHKKSWPRLKSRRLYGVTLVSALVLEDRLQRRALGQRTKLGAGENLLPHRSRTHLPFREIGVRGRHALELLHRLCLGLIISDTQRHLRFGFLRVNSTQEDNW